MTDARLPEDWRIYRLVALGFLALKLALLFVARPFVDETYYWLWGLHPALSYFDHPPLVGWVSGLSSAVFGWNIVGLRAPVLLTLMGDAAILYAFARHLGGGAWRAVFWPSLALFAATPIFLGLTNLALPDHLLVFFALLAGYAATRFKAGWEAGQPRWRFLYLAAAAIGFAILSKFLALLLAGGLLAAVLMLPALRPLLRRAPLYLAAGLILAMQLPVVIWNWQHDWASFAFIVGGRQPLGEGFFAEGLIGYLIGIPFVLSPFLLVPLARFLMARDAQGQFARVVFWLSTVAFLGASLFTNILIHWNVLAYVAVLPFLAGWLRPKLLVIGHFVYGGLLAMALAVNYTAMPLVAPFTYTDQTTSLSYGWEEVLPVVERLRADNAIGFVATPYYMSASALAFALGDRDVTSLAPGRDAFDDWFDTEAHRGEDAIIVADRKRGVTRQIRQLFESVRRETRLDIYKNGVLVERYSIYLARRYSPPG